jgi:hypothetical protein
MDSDDRTPTDEEKIVTLVKGLMNETKETGDVTSELSEIIDLEMGETAEAHLRVLFESILQEIIVKFGGKRPPGQARAVFDRPHRCSRRDKVNAFASKNFYREDILEKTIVNLMDGRNSIHWTNQFNIGSGVCGGTRIAFDLAWRTKQWNRLCLIELKEWKQKEPLNRAIIQVFVYFCILSALAHLGQALQDSWCVKWIDLWVMAPKEYFDKYGFGDVGENRARAAISDFARAQSQLSGYTVELSFVKLTGLTAEEFGSCYDKTKLKEEAKATGGARVSEFILPERQEALMTMIAAPFDAFISTVESIERQSGCDEDESQQDTK